MVIGLILSKSDILQSDLDSYSASNENWSDNSNMMLRLLAFEI